MSNTFYSEQQNLAEFSLVLNHVRHLIGCYLEHIYRQAEKGIDFGIDEPNVYTLVRAIDLVLYDSDLITTIGTCSLAQHVSQTTFTIRIQKHYWLTWKGMYIIDVLPIHGKFGISYPEPVFEERIPKRFKARSGFYEDSWSPEVRKLADREVENLALVLDNFVQKVSS